MQKQEQRRTSKGGGTEPALRTCGVPAWLGGSKRKVWRPLAGAGSSNECTPAAEKQRWKIGVE